MSCAGSWLYDLGAGLYRWLTSQGGWSASGAQLASYLPPGAPRVLDIGCGPGLVAAEVARVRPAAEVYGLDVAARMLAEARRLRPPGLTTRLLRADAAALPFPPAVFDAVTGHSFLYLVPQRAMVLAEAWRVLKPGGRLLLMEPWAGPAAAPAVLRYSRDPRFLVSVALWRAFNRFQGRFGAAELARLLRRQGFASPRGRVVLGGLGLLAYADKPARPESAQAGPG